MNNHFTRRDFLKNTSALSMFPFIRSFPFIPAEDLKQYGNVIEAPVDPSLWDAFRKELIEWRLQARKAHNYNDAAYADPAFKWTQSDYSCLFLFMYDEGFFDWSKNVYTVEKVIETGKKEFGGYDSIVLWHAYPKIGFDERNQFDYYRDMPGGLPGLRKVVDQFHEAGIKVFINYNPWDTGTRREGKSDLDALAAIVSGIDADGIFLDTLKNASFDFRGKMDDIKPGIVVEGEIALELENLPTHHLSWAQDFGDKYIPGVLRNKWYEPRHIQHQISRWSHDHSSEIHQAWMNGSGVMIWENVFGQWLPWHERDKSLLRTILPIQRQYSALFNSEGFVPLIQTDAEGVFANVWKKEGLKLYTLVNRHHHDVSGMLITIDDDSKYYYDIVAGEPAKIKKIGSKIVIEGKMWPRGVGCLIATDEKPDERFLQKMKLIKTGYKHGTVPANNQAMLKKVNAVTGKQSPEMIEIKPAITRQITMIESRECGTYSSGPTVAVSLGTFIPFDKTVTIPHLAIDKFPVTNKDFQQFLQSSGYKPGNSTHFLRHWNNGNIPPGKENHPVVYVDINDARAYAKWARKRLPTEEEWQYVAHGYTYPKYPWGNELEMNKYNDGNDTAPVDAYPAGASPFGCMDMCGNAWEMTESEYSDGHNRFLMLKGGTYFKATTSHWYVTGGALPSNVSTKFLLMYGGIDRCSTIGFRCVRDLS